MSEEEEEWRPAVDYEELYQVSSLGRVRSLDREVRRGHHGVQRMPGRLLRLRPFRGYLSVTLYKGGGRRTWMVHRLVCFAFHGAGPPGTEVAHSDGNKANNRPGNLRWATRSENVQDRDRHGAMAKGERHTNSTLTDEVVLAIIAFEGSHSAAADHFGLTYNHAKDIRTGRLWAHLSGGKNKLPDRPRQRSNRRRVIAAYGRLAGITFEQAEALLARLQAGEVL